MSAMTASDARIGFCQVCAIYHSQTKRIQKKVARSASPLPLPSPSLSSLSLSFFLIRHVYFCGGIDGDHLVAPQCGEVARGSVVANIAPPAVA